MHPLPEATRSLAPLCVLSDLRIESARRRFAGRNCQLRYRKDRRGVVSTPPDVVKL